jgi:hypothetical protein
MIEITNDVVRTGLQALVDAAGEDFVYTQRPDTAGTRCVYVHEGKPDCIVGQFLVGLGVSIERLESADARFGGVPAYELLDQLEQEGIIEGSWQAHSALNSAQAAQDDGHTWGEALRHALEDLDGE